MTDDKQSKLSDLIELYYAEPLNKQQLILLASLLMIERKEVKQQLDQWKNMACEYSDCLQKLCMDRLYRVCEPVSHSWPGKPHVEGVEFLIQQLAAAREVMRPFSDALKSGNPLSRISFDHWKTLSNVYAKIGGSDAKPE